MSETSRRGQEALRASTSGDDTSSQHREDIRLLSISLLCLGHATGRDGSLGPVVQKKNINKSAFRSTAGGKHPGFSRRRPWLELCHPLLPLYVRKAVRKLGRPRAERQE